MLRQGGKHAASSEGKPVKRRNWALGAGVAAGGVAGMALVAAALAITAGTQPTGQSVTPVMTANAAPLVIPNTLRPGKATPGRAAPGRVTPGKRTPSSGW